MKKILLFIFIITAIIYSCDDYIPSLNPKLGLTNIYVQDNKISILDFKGKDTIGMLNKKFITEKDTVRLIFSCSCGEANIIKFNNKIIEGAIIDSLNVIAPTTAKIDSFGDVIGGNKFMVFEHILNLPKFSGGETKSVDLEYTCMASNGNTYTNKYTLKYAMTPKHKLKTFTWLSHERSNCFNFTDGELMNYRRLRGREEGIDIVLGSKYKLYSPNSPNIISDYYNEKYLDKSKTHTTYFKKVSINFDYITDTQIRGIEITDQKDELEFMYGNIVAFVTSTGIKGFIHFKKEIYGIVDVKYLLPETTD